MRRGDVVLVDFPFDDRSGSKVRPALVIQNDADNASIANSIFAMISGNLKDQHKPTTVVVDPNTTDGAGSNLRGVSLIKCGNLMTMRQSMVIHSIGTLSAILLNRVNAALRIAIELP